MSFLSASSSISRNSQILPSYFFHSGSLNQGLGNIPLECEQEPSISSSPEEFTRSSSNLLQSNDYPRYQPIHPLTGAPIYNSISMGSEEYKERLRANAGLRKSQEFERTQGRAPPEQTVSRQSKSLCILGQCEQLPGVLGDYYKVSRVNSLGREKQRPPIYVKDEKILSSISKNIVNTGNSHVGSNANGGEPSDTLKSMFSVKSTERKEPCNKVRENALIQEFKKNSGSAITKRPLFPAEEFSPITCMGDTCSNLKGAINVLGVTGKIFMDVLFQLVNAFDLDNRETSSSHKKFGNMPHFPVSSIEIPPDTVILQCFDCGLIYYTALPLNKQQLGTIGILDPKPLEFGLPDSEEVLYGVSDRSSPYYCWGNLEPRDLTPNQIEFLRKVDLRKCDRLSHQDLVDLYYHRFRRDRRFDGDFPSFVQSDPQLHLYKFYRETMHAAYHGNKTPLPDIGNHFLPSPWDENRTSTHKKSRSSSSCSDRQSHETKNNFERDQDGFIILPKLDPPPSEHREEHDLVHKPDNSHIFPFILDCL